MSRAAVAMLIAVVAGCTPVSDRRVRDLTADGQYLYQRGDYSGARETFELASQLAPEDLTLRCNLARCQEKVGKLGEAEKTYTAVLQKEAGHVEARYALAQLLVREGRQDEAVEVARQWLISQPDRAPPYALDGWLWHQQGDLPRAQARLQQALQYDPADVLALNELGLVFEEQHRFNRALYVYEESLRERPNQPEIIDRVNRLKAKGAGPPRPDPD